MIGNLLTLDIIDGYDVTSDNCILRQNKTDLLGRGPYDYIVGIRDEMLLNRGYNVTPYFQTEWSYKNPPNWTPEELNNLETWFSPEYFHPETSVPTSCVELENRSTASNASGDAVQNTPAKMPTLTSFSTPAVPMDRGLTILDFDGSTDYMDINTKTDWNVSVESFFCCVVLHGVLSYNDDEQIVVKKGNTFRLYFDTVGGSKDAVFECNDPIAAAVEIRHTGAAQIRADRPFIYTFGRYDNGSLFFFVRSSSASEVEATLSPYNGDLDVATKPRIGANLSLGSDDHYSGAMTELIFVNDAGQPGTNVNDLNIEMVEGYLAHKYRVNKEILHPDHAFYENPPPATKHFG